MVWEGMAWNLNLPNEGTNIFRTLQGSLRKGRKCWLQRLVWSCPGPSKRGSEGERNTVSDVTRCWWSTEKGLGAISRGNDLDYAPTWFICDSGMVTTQIRDLSNTIQKGSSLTMTGVCLDGKYEILWHLKIKAFSCLLSKGYLAYCISRETKR